MPTSHGFTPLKAFAGLGLLAAWVVFLQATRRSLGAGGALLVLALFGCTIWAMVYYGVLSPTSSKAIAHLILIAVALVLAIGVSWSTSAASSPARSTRTTSASACSVS